MIDAIVNSLDLFSSSSHTGNFGLKLILCLSLAILLPHLLGMASSSTSVSIESNDKVDRTLVADRDSKAYFGISDDSIEVSIDKEIPPQENVDDDMKKTSTMGMAKSKTVFLIRHAESAENHRLACLTRSLSSIAKLRIPSKKDVKTSFELVDVNAQIDSDVSPKGECQIKNLAQQLEKDDFIKKYNVSLIAHSPLKRARQTCKGMFGFLAEPGDAEGKIDNEDTKTATTVPRVVELDFLRERTPAEWLPHGNGKLASRIDIFETWLNKQAEETVAVVGHSQYFKFMLGLKFKYGNCDVWQLKYQPNINSSSQGLTSSYRRRDDFEDYDGPKIDCGSSSDAVSTPARNNKDIFNSSAMESSYDPDTSSSLLLDETTNIDLPRGWSMMKNLYKVKDLKYDGESI